MNIKTTENKNLEQKNDISIPVITQEEEGIISNVNMPFSDVLASKIDTASDGLIAGLEGLIPSDFKYDSLSMNLDDALFFINLTQNAQFSINNVQDGNIQTLIQTDVTQNVVSQKSVEVTNQLFNLIQKAHSTNKPVRISFDNDVSVILKIDKHGKLTAEFIPGNIEAENFLRNNIASLKQRFDEQNLPYNDILYRQNNRQNRNKKERGEQ